MTIVSNNCTGSKLSGNGIECYKITDSTIVANICAKNNQSGIEVNTDSINNIFNGNICNDNKLYGIRNKLTSKQNSYISNSCKGNVVGIQFEAGSDHCAAKDNSCNLNTTENIYATSSSNLSINGNTCYGGLLTTGNGIHIVLGCDNSNISLNVCNENLNAGIYAETSKNINVSVNVCNNCKFGILTNICDNILIAANKCTRGGGKPADFTTIQYTIYVQGGVYVLLAVNMTMGKTYASTATGLSTSGHKFN